MHSDTLSTIYTLLANKTDNYVDSSPNNSPKTLMESFYDLLPSIAIIDADNYETHFEQLKNFTHHISQIMTDAAISKVSIGVGGGFSAGKSRFINTLIDMDVLPEAIEPCTAVATYLTHNNNDDTQAFNIFNTAVDVKQAQLKQLRHFIGDDSEKSLHISQVIKHVTINTPHIKWQNITFLDTPGYSKADADDSIVNDENLALCQLSAVDHIVWLVSAKNGTIRAEDIQFLHKINPKTPIFVVLTQADLVNQIDTDIPLIMQSVKDHLEDSDIELTGIMAWAAPAYNDKGEHIAGNDIRDWLDDLNNQQIDTHLSQLIDYCDRLNLTAQNKLDNLDKDNSYDEELSKMISKGQEQIKDYKEAIIELVSEHSAFDWDLAEMYVSGNIAGGIDKAIDIYKTKLSHNKDRAIDKLNSLVFETYSINCIQALADIYDEQLDHPEAAAKYHSLILRKHPETKQADESWKWLFNQAKNNETVFKQLHDLINDLKNPKYTYEFAFLADKLNHHEMSIELLFTSAETYHLESLSHLESKAEKDSAIKLRLGNIYKKSLLSSNQNKAIKFFKELAISNNQEALNNLIKLAKTNREIGLLALITLANLYEQQFDDLDKAAKYHCLIVERHAKPEYKDISIKWLLNHAKENKSVFDNLHKLVIKLNESELNYKFGMILDSLTSCKSLNNSKLEQMAEKFILRSAQDEYVPALNWLVYRSSGNPDLKLQLALIYEKSNSQENRQKSFQTYKKLAGKGNNKAIERLEVLAKKQDKNSNKAIKILTDIFDTSNPIKASIYHQLTINRQTETQVAQKSWDWLFTHAVANKTVFNTLKNLVDEYNNSETNFKMLQLADSIQCDDIATDYAIKNAINNHVESKNWLIDKANFDNHPAEDKIYNLYNTSNKVDDFNNLIYEYLIQRIIKGSELAFQRLKKLACYHNDYKAMWLLSICYTYGKGVEKSHEDVEYHLKQAANHIEEAQYNLDVLHYLKIKQNHPYYWILVLTSDGSDPLFKNLGIKKYLIYFGFIIPTFIDWNYETSYERNTKAIAVYTVSFFIILSLII